MDRFTIVGDNVPKSCTLRDWIVTLAWVVAAFLGGVLIGVGIGVTR